MCVCECVCVCVCFLGFCESECLCVCGLSCVGIRIFIKNHKSNNPGANKVVYGPGEQESEEKNSKF